MPRPSPGRVLVVDDDDALRKLLILALNRAHLVVDDASDGQQAIRRLEDRSYAVLLLDLLMPNKNGMDVIEYLKLRRFDPPPVVIVITAADDTAEYELDDNIVTVVLHKPLNLDTVVSVVKSVYRLADNRSKRSAAPQADE